MFSTPRSYTPDGSNLTRRPLSTPHRSSSRLERTQSTKSTTILTTTKAATPNNPKEKSKSSGIFSFCRYLIPVLVVLVLLLMLVYYHMEEGAFKELTGKFWSTLYLKASFLIFLAFRACVKIQHKSQVDIFQPILLSIGKIFLSEKLNIGFLY